MSIILAVLIGWFVLIFSLKVVEVLTDGSLSRSLHRRNITLKFGYFRFHTTSLNAQIERLAQRRRRALTRWFDVGVYLGLAGLLFSLVVLALNITQALTPPPKPPRVPPVIERAPRVPIVQKRPLWLLQWHWNLLLSQDVAPSEVLAPPGKKHLYDIARGHDVGPLFVEPPPDMGEAPAGLGGGHPGCKNGPRSAFRREAGGLVDITTWVNRFRRRRDRRRRRARFGRGGRRSRGGGRWRYPNAGGLGRGPRYRMRMRMRKRVLEELKHGGLPPLPDADEIDEQADLQGAHEPLRRARRLLAVPEVGEASVSNNSVASKVEDRAPSRPFLTPIVPGVTVPAGDIWYMLPTLLIAGFVHELGHAVAAASQDGEVANVGGFIALLLPVAFAQLYGIKDLRPLAQLRITCAGAYHNFVTAMFAMFLVRFLATFVLPMYATGNGALIVGVPSISPLAGNVQVADVLLDIGGENIKNGGESFRSVVSRLVQNKESVGFCVSDAALAVSTGNSSGIDCCHVTSDNERKDPNDSRECFRRQGRNQKVCIDPTHISSTHTCRVSLDCSGVKTNPQLELAARAAIANKSGNMSVPQLPEGRIASKCYVPEMENNWQLVDIRVRSGQTGEVMHYFFEGPGYILGQSVAVSSYVPRVWHMLPWGLLQVVASMDVPNVLERFLQYFASISLGFAILNMAPVLYTDGDLSSGLFVRWVFKGISEKRVKRIRAGTVLLGSMLLGMNMLLGLWGIRR